MSEQQSYSKDDLLSLTPHHAKIVCIDSDGCVFDTMTVKQIKFFHGRIIEIWELESVETCVRQVAEFVNLFSQTRGTNRFLALAMMFDMLAEHQDIIDSGLTMPTLPDLKAFIASGTPLSQGALETEVGRTNSEELTTIVKWSKAVNADIDTKMGRIPPFEWAIKALNKIEHTSDAIVVSQTPEAALVKEWHENELSDYVSVIAGQELGTKTVHIELATKGKYDATSVMMIGDAPGDLRAAKANKSCFYPVNPGDEERSWERFCTEAYGKFMDGTYVGEYQDSIIAEYNELLPKDPPWKQ